MSESPFSPPEAPRSKLRRLLIATAAITVTVLALFSIFGGADDGGTGASQPAGETGSGSSVGKGSGEEPTETEKTRDVSAKFIEAVYGYSGDSEEEYRQAVMEYSQSYDLLSSPGGEEIQSYAEQVGEGGLSGAARLTAFNVERTTSEEITTTVEFVVGEGTDGQITGESTAYRQQLSLRPHQDTYKVNYATTPEPV